MSTEEQAVIEAAQGVDNCMDDGGDHVWTHTSPGACLDLLRKALVALNKSRRRKPARARMAGR